MKKILIVDDHAIVRQGVIRVLQDVLEQPVEFDEASEGAQAIRMVLSGDYAGVLLDLSLPDQDGMNVLKLLNSYDSRLPVVVLSTHPEEHFAVRALRSGAVAYVNKASSSSVLKDAIEKALAGRSYVSPAQAELLAEAIRDNRQNVPLHETLSDREYQFIGMLKSGKTLTEIADTLSLSVKTVSTYRARVLEKLHLRTTADIINYCNDHKLFA